MRKNMFVLLVILFLLAVMVVPTAAINGGELDGEGHPNVGLMIADEEGEPAWRCSGTLIHPRVFLTAGHCVYGASRARVWFDSDIAGVPDYPTGGEVAIEGTPKPHPKYDDFQSPDNPYDVGVVIFEEPVVDIPLATTPDEGLLDGLKKDGVLRNSTEVAKFTVVGFGTILESWPPPVIVSEKIRRIAESEYVALVPAQLHLSQRAVFEEGGTCFGDSGGPVFWSPDDDTEILVGITSWGDAQCVATGFYYRVDIAETLAFIDSVIAELPLD
jgi:secreted trypsin-like serine protease